MKSAHTYDTAIANPPADDDVPKPFDGRARFVSQTPRSTATAIVSFPRRRRNPGRRISATMACAGSPSVESHHGVI